MPKMMLHHAEARAALGRGVGKLALAVRGTLGPQGTNAIIDRPIGTPMISRDGVSIAAEIELPCRFENMGAQVVREVSKQTNDVAGDGTTTATVLADALVQDGIALLADGNASNTVELVAGIDRACAFVIGHLRESARPLDERCGLDPVATVAATDPALGRLVADALRRVGPEGVVDIEYGPPGAPTALSVLEGMTLDRGFVSHHMATDAAGQAAVLERPRILLTDHKITAPEPLLRIVDLAARDGRPLLVVADAIAPEVVASMMALRGPGRDGRRGTVVAINPPDFGHWRRSMMEDIAILTGGRVIARDLGGRLETVTPEDLGSADRVEVTIAATALLRGHGEPETIRARRDLVQRQWEEAPPNIERDKLAQRLAKLTHGTALIQAGGATPVEQKRTAQLLEDSLAAARAALAEGVVAGGGTALARIAPLLDRLAEEAAEGERAGVRLVQRALLQPLACIAANAGLNGADVVARVAELPDGSGLDARTGRFGDLFAAGIVDPDRVTRLALENAASVAKLILTTHTLIADIPDAGDPTAGPARGGGAEVYGRH